MEQPEVHVLELAVLESREPSAAGLPSQRTKPAGTYEKSTALSSMPAQERYRFPTCSVGTGWVTGTHWADPFPYPQNQYPQPARVTHTRDVH